MVNLVFLDELSCYTQYNLTIRAICFLKRFSIVSVESNQGITLVLVLALLQSGLRLAE